MSKPGNYTAYQQYKPKDNGTIQSLQHWTAFYEQKRQNDIAQEQREKALQNQKEKEERTWVDGLLQIDPIKATGVKSVDELNADIGAKAYEQRTALVEKLMTLKPGTSEYLKTMALLNSNANIPKDINGIKNAMLENAKKYAEGKDVTVTAEPYLDTFYQNLDKAEIVIDPNTQKTVVLVEDPQDSTKKITLTYQDILNGKGDFKLTPKINRDQFIKENAKILNQKPPTKDRIDATTGYLLTEEGYEEPSVEQIAKNMFSDSEGNPTEYAISFSKQKGIYDLNQIKSPENLAKLEEEFITEITPLLVDKNKIKTNTNELQRRKNETDAAYKNRMAAVAEKNANTKVAIALGEGKIKKPVTLSDFKELPKPDGKGRIGFNVVDNALVVSYGAKGNEVERKVTGIWINPKNKQDIKINYIETGKKPDAYGTAQPYSEKKTFDSATDGEMAGTFSAEIGQTLEELHTSLMKKSKPKQKVKAKAKKKETLEERKKRLGLK
jgi:hypothetical protein